jgi:hypothetical protein
MDALLPIAAVAGIILYVVFVVWLVMRNMQTSFLMLASLRLVVGLIIALGMGFGLLPAAAGLPLGVILALGIWYGVAFIRSRFGKWSQVANRSRHSGSFTGRRWILKSGLLGVPTAKGMGHPLIAMQAWLILGTDEGGLYLSHHLIGRPFHSAVYVPWEAIKVLRPENVFRWFQKLYVDIALGPDGVVLRLDRKFATRLLAEHGPALPALAAPAAAPAGRVKAVRV